ncbi:hypothetical protein [Pseudomonas brassicacearum]|uniref:hypothetical protein n=1 Tax=Pseudomonas brassicacearum TaxID=930166 RepID=UPI000A98E87D|nr:hypothetical protein [Pseudomonas brassicacearum]
MIRGGIADKLGNGYEDKWALKQALFVLQGRADEIRIEPIGEDAGGFEFRLTSGEISEWHQCKSRTTKGSWTVKALEQEGVLEAFARKLKDLNSVCVFVSSDPVKILDGIAAKARLFSSASEFSAGLNKDEVRDLDSVRRVWQSDLQTTYAWFGRCNFEVVSEHTLDKDLDAFCTLLFNDESGVCIDRLNGLLKKQLTITLGTSLLRRKVDELGLGWRAQLDPSVETLINSATDQYLDTLRRPFQSLNILTNSTRELIKSFESREEKTIIVAGQAGCGKSSALATLIEYARNSGVPVLSFRVDRFLACGSVMSLGESLLGRGENPVGVLGNRYPGAKTLLVVDQVDSISEVSGRSPRARDIIFELIRSANFYPQMIVVIACRAYDLDNDSRLVRLVKDASAKDIRITPLDWDAEVSPVLSGIVRRENSYSEREKKILSVPINLNLYCELVTSGFNGEITASSLFDSLLTIRAREFLEAGCLWTPHAVLGIIAERMSESQELTVSAAFINGYPGAVDILSSAGLITCVNNTVQFAHESFFDNVFSSHFLTLNLPVADLLRASEQRLFRRTQVRQILSRLRDQGAGRKYIENLDQVMNSSDIRYLIKDAVGMWLANVELPDRKELAIVLQWFKKEHPLKKIAQTIFNGIQWIALLISSGKVMKWISSQDSEEKTFGFWLLRRAATTHSAMVAANLSEWLNADLSRNVDLIAWFGSLHADGTIGELEPLYLSLIRTCPIEFFSDGGFPKDFQLGTWAHRDCAFACRVLNHWLQRWFELFSTGHPFDSLLNNSNSYWLKKMAENSPLEFLQALIPIFTLAVFRHLEGSAKDGSRSFSNRRLFNVNDDDYSDLSIQKGLKVALVSVAANDPDSVVTLLEGFPTDIEAQVYLHLQAVIANGSFFATHLLKLLDAPLVLECGVQGVEWLPFAEASRVAIPYLSDDARAKIETLVVDYEPELNRAAEEIAYHNGRGMLEDEYSRKRLLYLLSRSGFQKRSILMVIGYENLSPITSKVLDQLNRKFPSEEMPSPVGSRGGWVQSPINSSATSLMGAREWLHAMRKYDSDKHHVYLKDSVIGGCRQLAQELQAAVKSNISFFVNMLQIMPLDINVVYAEAIISGLGEIDLDAECSKEAVSAAFRWPAGAFDRSICWFVRRHPIVASDSRIIDRMFHIAEFGLASDYIVTSQKRAEDYMRVSDILGHGGDLDMSGLNSDRGAAYLAISNYVWLTNEHLSKVVQFVSKQIGVEPLVSVRMQILHLIGAISKYDQETAVKLLVKLGEVDLGALACRTGVNISRWAVFNYTSYMSALVYKMCASDEDGLKALGFLLLSDMSLSDVDVECYFKNIWAEEVLARQVAAFNGAVNVGAGIVAERAMNWLLELYFDSVKLVRDETAGTDWLIAFDSLDDDFEFAKIYLSSPAFEESPDGMFRAISERIEDFPDMAMCIVERVVNLLEVVRPKEEAFRFGSLHELGQVLINLYRVVEGTGSREKQILDIFDAYLAHESYGAREALADYERI